MASWKAWSGRKEGKEGYTFGDLTRGLFSNAAPPTLSQKSSDPVVPNTQVQKQQKQPNAQVQKQQKQQKPRKSPTSRRVLVVGPGFGLKANPGQMRVLVQESGFKVEVCYVEDPEPLSDTLIQAEVDALIRTINQFQPDAVLFASKGGLYAVRLWSRGVLLPTVMINAHPLCKEIPKNLKFVVAHGAADEIWPRSRESLDALVQTGTRGHCFVYYGAGQKSGRPDKHNMASLQRNDNLVRLVHAVLAENPEAFFLGIHQQQQQPDSAADTSWEIVTGSDTGGESQTWEELTSNHIKHTQHAVRQSLSQAAVGALTKGQQTIYNNADAVDGSLKRMIGGNSRVGKIAQSMLHAGVDQSRSLLKGALVKAHVKLKLNKALVRLFLESEFCGDVETFFRVQVEGDETGEALLINSLFAASATAAEALIQKDFLNTTLSHRIPLAAEIAAILKSGEEQAVLKALENSFHVVVQLDVPEAQLLIVGSSHRVPAAVREVEGFLGTLDFTIQEKELESFVVNTHAVNALTAEAESFGVSIYFPSSTSIRLVGPRTGVLGVTSFTHSLLLRFKTAQLSRANATTESNAELKEQIQALGAEIALCEVQVSTESASRKELNQKVRKAEAEANESRSALAQLSIQLEDMMQQAKTNFLEDEIARKNQECTELMATLKAKTLHNEELRETLKAQAAKEQAALKKRMQLEIDRLIKQAEATQQQQQNSTTISVSFPSTWKTMPDDQATTRDFTWWNTTHFIELHPGPPEYKEVIALFKNGLPAAQVSRIERIQHRLLYSHYSRRFNVLGIKHGGEAQERFLFHGTNSLSPKNLLLNSETGLDLRFANSNGFYGSGVYFAENSRYSHHYAYRNSTKREHQMLVCKVALGSSFDYKLNIDRQLRLPPHMAGSSQSIRHDSVQGGPHQPSQAGPGKDDSVMHIVYNNEQVYPNYIITYTL